MSDLDDLDHRDIRYQAFKFNALTGVGQVNEFELGWPSIWTADMYTRRRGYGKTGDGVFEFYLTPVGSEPPKPPQDDKFKPAIAILWWSPQYGLAEMITNSTLLRRTVSDFWEVYKSYQEAADGLLPVTEFGAPKEVQIGKNNMRIFWTPVLTIVGWMSRDEIPALKYRPATVPPPIRLDQQTLFYATRSLPSPAEEQNGQRTKKAVREILEHSKTETREYPHQERAKRNALSEILDDEIPELGGNQ
jgi:hypothetical protein